MIPTTAAIATAAALIPHHATCPAAYGATLRQRESGVYVVRCQTCRRTARLLPLPTSLPTSLPAFVVRYVCRPHLQPVNWRGRGCQECAQEAQSRRQAARKRRPEVQEP